MKCLFNLLLILPVFLPISAGAQSGWKKVYEDAYIRAYIDPGSVKQVYDPQSSSVYSLLDMVDYIQMAEGPNGGGQYPQIAVSIVHSTLIDCASSNFRVQGFQNYQTHNAAGNPNADPSRGSRWTHTDNASKEFKAIYRSICR